MTAPTTTLLFLASDVEDEHSSPSAPPGRTPLRTILLSIANRFTQGSDSTVIVGAASGGLLGYFQPDTFFYLTLLLLVLTMADWLFGRHAARAQGRWDRKAARNGLVAKGGQMVILLSLRSLEAVLPIAAGLPSSFGLISSALAAALVLEELESVERHRIALGGKPLPLLSAALTKIRALTGSDQRLSSPEADERRGGPEDRRS